MLPTSSDPARPAPGAPRELGRGNLAVVYFGLAFAALGTVHLAGAMGRAPAVAAGVLLVAALAAAGLRAFRAAAGRWLWLIRWKLAVSYVIIAFVPLLLVSATLVVVAYVATGSLLARLAAGWVSELQGEVAAVAASIAEEAAQALGGESDPERVRRAVNQFDGGEDLRALRGRFGKEIAASALFLPAASSEGYAFALLPFPVGGERVMVPSWVASDLDAERTAQALTVRELRSRGGPREVLELKAAQRAVTPAGSIYVEVSAPITGSVLDRLANALDVDVAVKLPGPLGQVLDGHFGRPDEPEPERSFLGRLPVLGVATLQPVRWATREGEPNRRWLVARRSIGGLLTELFGSDLERARLGGTGRAELSPRQEGRGFLGGVLILVLAALLLAETLSLLVGLRLARSITGSIHEIFEGTRRIERGELQHRIAVTSGDQLGSLSQSFNRMTESIEGLLVSAAERERLEEELRIGRRIQQSLLPRGDWKDERFDIAALSLPAKEVGGDYYDLIDLGGDRLAMLIADVSGKGTEAAFYMAEVKGIMLALARLHQSPSEVLREANVLLSGSLDRRTFVTMTYGVLDRGKRIFRFARAGHNPILFLGAQDSCARSLRPDGMALGVDRTGRLRSILEEAEVCLEPGSLLLLYTDGVTDTMDEEGGLYGEERLKRVLESLRARDAEGVRNGLLAELRRFAAKGPPHDDLTVIVVRALEG